MTADWELPADRAAEDRATWRQIESDETEAAMYANDMTDRLDGVVTADGAVQAAHLWLSAKHLARRAAAARRRLRATDGDAAQLARLDAQFAADELRELADSGRVVDSELLCVLRRRKWAAIVDAAERERRTRGIR